MHPRRFNTQPLNGQRAFNGACPIPRTDHTAPHPMRNDLLNTPLPRLDDPDTLAANLHRINAAPIKALRPHPREDSDHHKDKRAPMVNLPNPAQTRLSRCWPPEQPRIQI